MTADLRSFIADAEAAGMVHDVSREVDPKTNLAALADESDRLIRFNNVAGYEGWTVVSNCVMNRDMERVAFGCKAKSDVVGALAQGFDRGPREHRVQNTGPVKEVVWEGDEADLRRLPVAQHSELDGGPYFGSAVGIVVDPDTGTHNTTWPRTQLADGKSCPFFVYSPHVHQIMAKYAMRNEPMPMALYIGHHPAWDVAASISMHHPNHGELDYVAGLLNEEPRFVKCDTIDVDVPADAEIVIEGEVPPGELADEGPFGNYCGTYASGPMARDGIVKAPVFRVKRVTMRKDPVFRHLQSTVWTEHQRLVTLPIEANMFTALREMGLNVHDVHIPAWGGCGLTLIQMTPGAPGEVQDALLKATEWENTTIGTISQVAVAVNKDVNIYDARDVVWAMTIRTNWSRDTTVVPNTRSSPLMPSAEKVRGAMFRVGSKALVDATCLPPRDATEWWDINRAWPIGQGTVAIEDYVDDYKAAPMRMERNVSFDEAMAAKPGNGGAAAE
jgi:2,5-furandicarboxylate decarboxylase 1